MQSLIFYFIFFKGGYFGGGCGPWDFSWTVDCAGSGGSSFINNSTSNFETKAGVNVGNGLVIITPLTPLSTNGPTQSPTKSHVQMPVQKPTIIKNKPTITKNKPSRRMTHRPSRKPTSKPTRTTHSPSRKPTPKRSLIKNQTNSNKIFRNL